jgi:hypothetical protein
MSYTGADIKITCKCGHSDDFDRFTTDAAGRNLQPGYYRCPACGGRWHLAWSGKPRKTPSGFVIPPALKVVAYR